MGLRAIFLFLLVGTAVALKVRVRKSNYPPVFSQLTDYAKEVESGLLKLNSYNLTIVGVEGDNLETQSNKKDGDNVVLKLKFLSLDAATFEGTKFDVNWTLHFSVERFNLNANTSKGKDVKIELAPARPFMPSRKNKLITSFSKTYDNATIPTLLPNLPKVEANQGAYFDFFFPYADDMVLDLALGDRVARDVSIRLPLTDYLEGKPLRYVSDGPVTFKKAGLGGLIHGLFGHGKGEDLTIGPLKLDVTYESESQSWYKRFNSKV